MEQIDGEGLKEGQGGMASSARVKGRGAVLWRDLLRNQTCRGLSLGQILTSCGSWVIYLPPMSQRYALVRIKGNDS